MSKKSPKGLSYFNIDTTFFSDIKVRKLIKYQSGKAITVYAYLLCNIYKEGYYMMWDNELPFMISESTGYDEAYIQEVIKCCLSIGLFDSKLFEKNKVLTSHGIQSRFEEICIKAKRRFRVSEFNLLITEETGINSEETPKTSEEMPENTEDGTQSKVKKRKEENTEHPQDLGKSNLYRQPVIPTKQQVWEVFSRNGGTKEMAKSFYEKYESTGWFLNGSPVINWTSLANRFITNWQGNEKQDYQSTAPPLKSIDAIH